MYIKKPYYISLCHPRLKPLLIWKKIDYERWATAQNKSESENCNKFEFRFETAQGVKHEAQVGSSDEKIDRT